MATRRDGNQSGSRKPKVKAKAPRPDVTLGGDRTPGRSGHTRPPSNPRGAAPTPVYVNPAAGRGAVRPSNGSGGAGTRGRGPQGAQRAPGAGNSRISRAFERRIAALGHHVAQAARAARDMAPDDTGRERQLKRELEADARRRSERAGHPSRGGRSIGADPSKDARTAPSQGHPTRGGQGEQRSALPKDFRTDAHGRDIVKTVIEPLMGGKPKRRTFRTYRQGGVVISAHEQASAARRRRRISRNKIAKRLGSDEALIRGDQAELKAYAEGKTHEQASRARARAVAKEAKRGIMRGERKQRRLDLEAIARYGTHYGSIEQKGAERKARKDEEERLAKRPLGEKLKHNAEELAKAAVPSIIETADASGEYLLHLPGYLKDRAGGMSHVKAAKKNAPKMFHLSAEYREGSPVIRASRGDLEGAVRAFSGRPLSGALDVAGYAAPVSRLINKLGHGSEAAARARPDKRILHETRAQPKSRKDARARLKAAKRTAKQDVKAQRAGERPRPKVRHAGDKRRSYSRNPVARGAQKAHEHIQTLRGRDPSLMSAKSSDRRAVKAARRGMDSEKAASLRREVKQGHEVKRHIGRGSRGATKAAREARRQLVTWLAAGHVRPESLVDDLKTIRREAIQELGAGSAQVRAADWLLQHPNVRRTRKARDAAEAIVQVGKPLEGELEDLGVIERGAAAGRAARQGPVARGTAVHVKAGEQLPTPRDRPRSAHNHPGSPPRRERVTVEEGRRRRAVKAKDAADQAAVRGKLAAQRRSKPRRELVDDPDFAKRLHDAEKAYRAARDRPDPDPVQVEAARARLEQLRAAGRHSAESESVSVRVVGGLVHEVPGSRQVKREKPAIRLAKDSKRDQAARRKEVHGDPVAVERIKHLENELARLERHGRVPPRELVERKQQLERQVETGEPGERRAAKTALVEVNAQLRSYQKVDPHKRGVAERIRKIRAELDDLRPGAEGILDEERRVQVRVKSHEKAPTAAPTARARRGTGVPDLAAMSPAEQRKVLQKQLDSARARKDHSAIQTLTQKIDELDRRQKERPASPAVTPALTREARPAAGPPTARHTGFVGEKQDPAEIIGVRHDVEPGDRITTPGQAIRGEGWTGRDVRRPDPNRNAVEATLAENQRAIGQARVLQELEKFGSGIVSLDEAHRYAAAANQQGRDLVVVNITPKLAARLAQRDKLTRQELQALLDDGGGSGVALAIPRALLEAWEKGHAIPGAIAGTSRVVTRAFLRATLPLSVMWHAGNLIDNATRAMVAGAGPISWSDFKEWNRIMRELDPKRADRITALMQGHFGSRRGVVAQPRVRDITQRRRNALEAALNDFSKTVGDSRIFRGAAAIPNTVIDKAFNFGAHTENVFVEAMMGRALVDSAAALGMRQIDHLELARRMLRDDSLVEEFQRRTLEMVGDYTKNPAARMFSPVDPFWNWFKASMKFTLYTLPVKHPVKAALLAAAVTMTEQDRRRIGLSYLLSEKERKALHVPDPQQGFLAGAIPVGDRYIPVAPFTSFGTLMQLLPEGDQHGREQLLNPVAALAGRILPFAQDPAGILLGKRVSAGRLVGGIAAGKDVNSIGYREYRPAPSLARALGESFVPGVHQVRQTLDDRNAPGLLGNPALNPAARRKSFTPTRKPGTGIPKEHKRVRASGAITFTDDNGKTVKIGPRQTPPKYKTHYDAFGGTLKDEVGVQIGNGGSYDAGVIDLTGAAQHGTVSGPAPSVPATTDGGRAPTAAEQALFEDAASKYGLDPAILWGLEGAESGHSQGALSSAGAQGWMQFMPGTAAGMGVDPHDRRSAVYGAARYLSQYKGRGLEGMLRAYNAGPAGADNPQSRQHYANTLAGAKTWPGDARSLRRRRGGRHAEALAAGLPARRDRTVTIAGASHQGERVAAALQFMRGELDTLGFVAAITAMADEPPVSYTIPGDTRTGGRPRVRAKGAVKAGGGYAGSQGVAETFAGWSGLTISSTKRTPAQNAAVGGSPSSDHLTTNTRSYAVDLSGTVGQMNRAFGLLSKRFGRKLTYNGYTSFTVKTRGGLFRVQVIYGPAVGHGDHIHIGVERVG